LTGLPGCLKRLLKRAVGPFEQLNVVTALGEMISLRQELALSWLPRPPDCGHERLRAGSGVE
jgi:hypothetical protein